MKPCYKNRKAIAWLAVGALDAREARELRAHFETCGHCRAYWNEMSRVTEKLAAAEVNPRIETGVAFHQKLTAKLRATESRSTGKALSIFHGRMFGGWRIVIPATVAFAFLVLVISQRHPGISQPLPVAVIETLPAQPDAEILPTMGNYEMAASESLDKLDELLTKQGGGVSTAAPVYTASMLKAPGATD